MWIGKADCFVLHVILFFLRFVGFFFNFLNKIVLFSSSMQWSLKSAFAYCTERLVLTTANSNQTIQIKLQQN